MKLTPAFRVLVTALLLFTLAGGAMGREPPRVALVMKALTNPFFTTMAEAAKERAAELGVHLEVFGTERETEVERQISMVEHLISRSCDAIVIAPTDSGQLVPVCKRALEAGIVVINVDNPFHGETLRAHNVSIPFVGPDNREGAAAVGEYFRRRLREKGRVAIIEGIRGVENAELRKQGFLDAVGKSPGIRVVAMETANWHSDEAFNVALRLLEEHEQLDGIFCANDNMALGVLQALEVSGQASKIWLGGYDNIEAFRNELRLQRVHATVEQHPALMGRVGVELAIAALDGKPVPELTRTPVDLVTFESFDKVVGLSVSNGDNPFFIAMETGARKAAELFGMQLLCRDAHDDCVRQLADLAAFVEQRVDAVLLNPTDIDSVAPGIELVNAASIPVVTVDRRASGGEVMCHIESDNREGGRMAAQYLAQQLGEGGGRVLELEGIPGVSGAYERGAGFNEVLLGYPSIRVVAREVAGFDRERARLALAAHLEKGERFDAVFAHNDNMILGALDAFDAAGVEDLPVMVGFDAIPEAIAEVRKGRLSATVAQQPEAMGYMGMKCLVAHLQGATRLSSIQANLELIRQ